MNQARQESIQSFAFVIGACVAIGLCFGLTLNPKADDSASRHNRMEWESRINPNNASAESLARLPGLGPGRAGAIVAYRDSHRDSPAFRDSEDLQNVRGIGPGTVVRIDDWIEFE